MVGAGGHLGGSAPSQQLVLRYERHLPATPHVMFPPTRDTSRGLTRWVIVFRNPKLPWYHSFSFTRAQRSERWLTIETGLDCRARTLFHQCQPCSLRLKKVPKRLIDRYARLGNQTRRQSAVCIDLTGDEAANLAAASFGRGSKSSEVAAMRAVRKVGVVCPTTTPTLGLSTPIAPTPRVGLSPLEHVLNKANGNQKWVIAPGFLEHVIAGGAVPQNGVALALHRLFSPSGLLVKLVNDAMKSRNFSALIVKEYGTVRPSVDQLNRLLYEHGIFDEIGLKLASSSFMVDFAYNYGPVLNNPDLMTRFTTLPPDIPKITNYLVSSTLANKEFLARPPPLGHRDSATTPSQSAPFHLSPALVPRQKPGPKSKRKPMMPFPHTARAPLVTSESAHKSGSSHNSELGSNDAFACSLPRQIDQKPLLLPPPSFSGSKSIAFNNIVNDPKLEELRRLAPKSLPDELLCKKLQNMIRQSMNPAFSPSQEHTAFVPEHSIFGGASTPSPPMGGSLITGDPLSSELFKHGAVNDVDEHGIPVIDIIDLSSDEEVERKITPCKNAFTKTAFVNSNHNSSSGSSVSNDNRGVGNSECLGVSNIALNNRHSAVKSVNNSNNHPNLGSGTTNNSYSTVYGNDGTNNLNNQSHSSYVSPANNNTSNSSGGRQIHTPESNGTTQTPRRTEQKKLFSTGKVTSSSSSPPCSNNTTEMCSKNERSHWPQSPRSSGLGGRKPGTFRVANGGQAVRSDWAGDTSVDDSERGSETETEISSNFATPSAQLVNEDYRLNEVNVVSSLCDDYNSGVFTLNPFYRGDLAVERVVHEDEARYGMAASVRAISADDRGGRGYSATVGCGATNRSGYVRIKTSLVPVTIIEPLLKNNNYLMSSPTYEYDACQAYTAPSYEWDACRIFDDKRRGKKRILSGYDSEYELDEIIRCASPKRVCLDKKETAKRQGTSSDGSEYYNYKPANGAVAPMEGSALTADVEDPSWSPRHHSFVVDEEISVRLPVLFADEEIIFSTDPGDDVIEDPPPLLMSGGPYDYVTSEDCFEGSEMFEVESALPPPSPKKCLENLPVVSAETLLEDSPSSNFSESCSGREVPQDNRSQSSSNGGSARSLLSSVLSKGYNFIRNIVSSSSEAAVKSLDQQNVCVGSSNVNDVHSVESRNVPDDHEKSPHGLERASSSDSKNDSSSNSSSEADDDVRSPRFSRDVLRCLQDECKELAGLKQLMSVDTGSTDRRVTRKSLHSLLDSPSSSTRKTHNSSQFFRRDEIVDHRERTSRKEIRKGVFDSECSETSSRRCSRRSLRNRNGSLTSMRGISTGGTPCTVSDSHCENDGSNESVINGDIDRTEVGDGNTGTTAARVHEIGGSSSSDASKGEATMLDEIALRLGESLAANLTHGILFDALTTSIQLHCLQMLFNQSTAVNNNNCTSTNNPALTMSGSTSTLNTSGYDSSGTSASMPASFSPVRQSARVTSRDVGYFNSRKKGPKSPSIMDSIKKRAVKSSDESSDEPTPSTVAWVRPAWITDSVCGEESPGSDSNRCYSPKFSCREFSNFRTAAPPSKHLRNDASSRKLGPSASSEKFPENTSQPQCSDDCSTTDTTSDREISVKGFKGISSKLASSHILNSSRVSSANRNYSNSSSSDEARSASVHSRKRDSVKNTTDSEVDSTPLIRRMNSHKRLRFRASRLGRTTEYRLRTRLSDKERKIPVRPTFRMGQRRYFAKKSTSRRLLESKALTRLARDEWKELKVAGCHPKDIIELCVGSSTSESDERSKASLRRRQERPARQCAPGNNRRKNATNKDESGATENLQGTGVEASNVATSGNLRLTKRIGAAELRALAADECKEMQMTGFHPKNVLNKMLKKDNFQKRASPSLTARTHQAEPSNPVCFQGNMNCETSSNPPTQVSLAPLVWGDAISTLISPSNYRTVGHVALKKSGRPSGWNNLKFLASDECKELRMAGFHPSDIVSSYMTTSRDVVEPDNETEMERVVEREREEGETCYTDCETDDEDSDEENQCLKSRKKRNSPSAHSRNPDGCVVSAMRNAQHGAMEASFSDLPSKVVGSRCFGRRELKNLMEDELKEFRRTGFHPMDIVNTFKTQESESSSSEDSDDEEYKGKKVLSHEGSFRSHKINAMEEKKANVYETDTEDVKPTSRRGRKKDMLYELRNLLADECKELKRRRNVVRERGSHRLGGLRRKLMTGVRPLSHSSPKRSAGLSGLVSSFAGIGSRYLDEAMSSRSRRTSKNHDEARVVPEVTLTARNSQRDMLQLEGAMCVVNYRLPDIS